MRSSGSQPGRSVVLTVRGRRAAAGAMVAGVFLLGLGVHAVWPAGHAQAPGPSPDTVNVAAASPVATPRATPSAGASSSTSARPTASRTTTTVTTTTTTRTRTTKTPTGTSSTMVHSGLAASGRFTTSTVAIPAAKHTAVTHTFVVKVESTVKASPNDVATQIEKTLNDPRGWLGYKGASFAAVADPATAEFVIYLAAPPTVDKMCVGVSTLLTWNCEVGKNVVLNSDRWFFMTPTYADVAEYRAYMVNHEIGHFLGLGHVGCPARGAKAPVMMTQSMDLQGCVRNAWPALQG